MANDANTACIEANRDVPNCTPGPFQDCSDVVHIPGFFDGAVCPYRLKAVCGKTARTV
jgi:hypothetical protein